jgi:hypothetical protein
MFHCPLRPLRPLSAKRRLPEACAADEGASQADEGGTEQAGCSTQQDTENTAVGGAIHRRTKRTRKTKTLLRATEVEWPR